MMCQRLLPLLLVFLLVSPFTFSAEQAELELAEQEIRGWAETAPREELINWLVEAVMLNYKSDKVLTEVHSELTSIKKSSETSKVAYETGLEVLKAEVTALRKEKRATGIKSALIGFGVGSVAATITVLLTR